MSEPCIQAPAIEKLDAKMDKVIEALQVLAVQKNEIDHLIKTQGDHRKWMLQHEERLRLLELLPGKKAGKAIWIGYGAAASVVGGVIAQVVSQVVSAAIRG